MRIEQLQYVEAVARLGSFRRASEEMHISQPALSETVRNLERELGVDLLDRSRAGARISAHGREVLPHIRIVLDAVDDLRRSAREQHQATRMVRIGTVNAATVSLVTPTIQELRSLHPATQVEVVGAQQDEIHRAMREGTLDLGLVTKLDGDESPTDIETSELLRGRAVACMRTDSPLADRDEITLEDLLREPLVMMRSGYLMHRVVGRLLGDQRPSFSYSTDGAEMGKLMVAQGLGISVLPDFSVIGDPMERAGIITCRPLTGDHPDVLLVLQRRRARTADPRPVRDLHRLFLRRAQEHDLAVT